MTNIKAKILRKCEFIKDEPYSGGDEVFEQCVVAGNIAGQNENARLLPIIRALLEDREELVKALENLKRKAACNSMPNECDGGETHLVDLKDVERWCDEALTTTTERLKQLAGEGE